MAITATQALLLVSSLGGMIPIDDPQMAAITGIHLATRTAINANIGAAQAITARLRAAGLSGFNAARQLILRVNAANPNQAQALTDARLVVVDMGLAWTYLTAGSAAAALGALRVSCAALTPAEKTSLGQFAGMRASGTALQVVQQLSAVVGAPTLNNLQLLCDVTDAATASRGLGDAQRTAGVTVTTLADLRYLHANHPHNSAFPGFAAWGPGDHGTAGNNLKWHFLKHVVGLTDVDEGEGPDFDECADWWRHLDIRLAWDTFEDMVPSSQMGRLEGVQERYFSGPGDTLSHGWVAAFIGERWPSWAPKLTGWLITNFMTDYRDAALNASQAFEEVLVQSNGVKTFVAGCQGDIFVIGRVAGGALGISSCYYARNIAEKMQGSRANKLWDLT